MSSPGELVKLYGTDELLEPQQAVSLGALSFLLGQDAIRCISWKGTELARAIAWPIRDRNWVTLQPRIIDHKLDVNETDMSYSLRFTVDEGALDCVLEVVATSAGVLRADLKMMAVEDFDTNRAGFTVLHPITGVAGTPLTVIHADGSVEKGQFPRLVSPAQPVMDIAQLRHGIDGKTVDISFDGEIFEMEDQRNWSDASYKTYCRPLVFPFTYRIETGASETQTITMTFSGGRGGSGATAEGTELSLCVHGGAAPGIGLAVEQDWIGSPEAALLAAQCGFNHLVARIDPGSSPAYLQSVAEMAAAQGVGLDIEIVLPDEADVTGALTLQAGRLAASGIKPSRIMALRQSYLASHQPSGPWPDGPVPSDVVKALRVAFPDTLVGGGMLTNFTELNRCRPNPEICDFISHGTTAIVHAGDDVSVCQTLEALPQIFESCQAICEGRPYRLGLVSIGMRSNPYGAAVADNPDQVRQTMSMHDPRQRGLFAAAWSVGVLQATNGHGVEALCLGAPCGPFGIAYERQPVPQPFFDSEDRAIVYPVFHVLKCAAAMAGRNSLAVSGLPVGVCGYGIRGATTDDLMIANVSPEPVSVALGREGDYLVLDSSTFDEATRSPNWLDSGCRQTGSQLRLAPYAVAFVRLFNGAE